MSEGSPSGIPYIGSRISLISVSGIRYEGMLYSIDPKQSTVSLQSVRSFGTEGRRIDGQQIPPSNNVYDYIIFRGSDIKDLQVCEPPPQPAQMQPPNDPAIINAPNIYGYPTAMYQYPYGNPYAMYNSYGYPGAYPPRPHQSGPPTPGQAFPSLQPLGGALPVAGQQQHQPSAVPSRQTNAGRQQHQHHVRSSNPSVDVEGREDKKEAEQQRGLASSDATKKESATNATTEKEDGSASEGTSPTEVERSGKSSHGVVYSAEGNQGNGRGGSKRTEADVASHGGSYAGASYPSGEKRERPQRGGHRGNGSQRNGNQQGGSQHNAGPSNAAGGSARGSERKGNTPSQPRTASAPAGGSHPHGRSQQGPDSRGSGARSGSGASGRYGTPQKLPEFDFEKANSKFDKEKIKEEVLKGVSHTDGETGKEGEQASLSEKAYDKSTSFFDNISCESLVRLKESDSDGGNVRSERRRNERSLNAETFGRAANDRRPHRGAPRRYGSAPHQAHQAHQVSHGLHQVSDNRQTRGGPSARGGYAAVVRGSSAPQKRFVPVGQKEAIMAGN